MKTISKVLGIAALSLGLATAASAQQETGALGTLGGLAPGAIVGAAGAFLVVVVAVAEDGTVTTTTTTR